MSLVMNAYRGPSNVPHVPENFFRMYFIGANAALLALSLPGRFVGSEVRPRKFNKDYIISCCQEGAMRREALSGKKAPTYTFMKPNDKADSWERMWDRHLHWKRWTQERMGPYYPPV